MANLRQTVDRLYPEFGIDHFSYEADPVPESQDSKTQESPGSPPSDPPPTDSPPSDNPGSPSKVLKISKGSSPSGSQAIADVLRFCKGSSSSGGKNMAGEG